MKIAIVEDSIEASQKLVRFLTSCCDAQQIPLDITLYQDGIEIVDSYVGHFDVIYFDVEMPIMDGMTAAKKIRKVDDKVVIVFVTNYVQWAVEGYSVAATDFLLKPLSKFHFEEHFKKISAKIQQAPKESYTLKTNVGIRKVFLDDLFFVESEGHYLHFYSVTGVYTILESLKNIEAQLKEKNFFRCNNSYLVNLKYVRSIEGNIVHVAKHELTVSRPRKKGFMTALTNYLSTGDSL